MEMLRADKVESEPNTQHVYCTSRLERARTGRQCYGSNTVGSGRLKQKTTRCLGKS